MRILVDLGFEIASEGEGRFEVTTPPWRHDCTRPADLVEELARIHGFDNIPAHSVRRDDAVNRVVLDTSQLRRARLRRALAARGLDETVTFSFVADRHAQAFGGSHVRLANPISSDLVAMRPSLLPSLAEAVARNQARALDDVALFEVAAVYTAAEAGGQEWAAAGVRAGRPSPRHWAVAEREADALDAKGDAVAALEAAGLDPERLKIAREAPAHFHPGRSAVLELGRNVVAHFGELNPRLARLFDWTGRVAAFEVFLDRLPQPKRKKTRARPMLVASAYQPVDRDFAFLVDASVAAGDLLAAVRGASEFIREVTLFDVYAGKGVPEGKRSMAVAVRLQALDRTLGDADIEDVARRVTAAAATACGAELRR
jgi:phenylalanyl-tRNA synthetase beta chain